MIRVAIDITMFCRDIFMLIESISDRMCNNWPVENVGNMCKKQTDITNIKIKNISKSIVQSQSNMTYE